MPLRIRFTNEQRRRVSNEIGKIEAAVSVRKERNKGDSKKSIKINTITFPTISSLQFCSLLPPNKPLLTSYT